MHCVEHAAAEELVAAIGVVEGRSACAEHGAEPSSSLVDATCIACPAGAHRAWFVVDGLPLCIRHAADDVFPDDDMGAHDMAHACYLALHRIGVTDAY